MPRPKKEVVERPPYAACPCGEVPSDIMINLPQGAKYGTVAGNCCGDWVLEFKAGYPKNNDELVLAARTAWNEAPRGQSK